jgi:hypothetical protein
MVFVRNTDHAFINRVKAMVRAVRRGNRLRGTRPFVLPCHWSKSSPFKPRNRPAGHVVTAANLGQRFAVAVAALDRFALLVIGDSRALHRRLSNK